MRLFSFAPFPRRWRLSGLAALLIALAAALFLLSGAMPAQAQAQTPDTLVSNIGKSGSATAIVGSITVNTDRFEYEVANLFTTGNDAGGYTLAGVDLVLGAIDSAAVPLVSIYTTTSADLPDSSLHVLSNPTSFTVEADTVNTFTAAPGAALEANTTYALVLQNTDATSNYAASGTSSDAEDSGAATGWSIGGRVSKTVSSNGAWTPANNPVRLAIKGYSTDSIRPKFSSATLTGDYKVTVNFDKPLKSGSCPGIPHWTVTYNGRAEWPIYVACYDRSVVLHSRTHNQSPSLAEHRTVTVSYHPQPSGARLQSVQGAEVASFSNRPVRNGYPLLSGASVNGKVLTLTYDQPLDASSAPPGSAFKLGVTGGGGMGAPPQPSVVRTAVSGNAVTLTLDQEVRHDRSMSLRYEPPASNPIRNPAGGEAKAITWRDDPTVRVLTPDPGLPPTFYGANLVHDRYASETRLVAGFDEDVAADADSMPPGSAFRVTARPRSGGSASTVAGTGTARVAHGFVSVTLAQQVAPDAIVTVSYVKPSANPLRGSDGNDVDSFTNQPMNNGSPGVRSVALSSNAGPDRTYALRDKIQVQVTFTGPVAVTGTPRLALSQGQSHPEKSDSRGGYYNPRAEYESGSGTPTLTFAYTVKELDRSNGIAVNGNALELNGGAIRTVASLPRHNADLSHSWLPYNARHKVDGSIKEKTYFESAAVDGATLTLTFDETLDTNSAPAPGAFHVTVNGARRDVASGGVAISGKTVTLALASAVVNSDTVKVRYTKPSTRPLRSTSGQGVDTFADRAVTNNSDLWSATLTVKNIPGTGIFGCDDDPTTSCSSGLTANSFTSAGKAYRVAEITSAVTIGGFVRVRFALDRVISEDWMLHVGDHQRAVADATLSDSGKTATWDGNMGLPDLWTVNQKVSLRLTTSGSGSSGPSGQSGGADPASVTGVSVVSSAGADKTYGDGDRIEVRATFDGPVDVTGTPRIKIDMDPADWGEKWAVYEEGGGTSSLTFVHTAEEPNLSTQGIAVVANSLELNGGTIRAGGNDANLAHTGLGHDANHKVDWQTAGEESGAVGTGQQQESAPPAVSGVAVTSTPQSNATYAHGETIQVTLTFSEAVTVTGTPRLKIDMDPAHWGEKLAAYHDGNGTTTLTFTHRVVEPNLSTQGIAVLANSLELNGGTIQADGVAADLSHTGLSHDASHRVDWRLSPEEEGAGS